MYCRVHFDHCTVSKRTDLNGDPGATRFMIGNNTSLELRLRESRCVHVASGRRYPYCIPAPLYGVCGLYATVHVGRSIMEYFMLSKGASAKHKRVYIHISTLYSAAGRFHCTCPHTGHRTRSSSERAPSVPSTHSHLHAASVGNGNAQDVRQLPPRAGQYKARGASGHGCLFGMRKVRVRAGAAVR